MVREHVQNETNYDDDENWLQTSVNQYKLPAQKKQQLR